MTRTRQASNVTKDPPVKLRPKKMESYKVIRAQEHMGIVDAVEVHDFVSINRILLARAVNEIDSRNEQNPGKIAEETLNNNEKAVQNIALYSNIVSKGNEKNLKHESFEYSFQRIDYYSEDGNRILYRVRQYGYRAKDDV